MSVLHLSYGESKISIKVEKDSKISKYRSDFSKSLGVDSKNILFISSETDNNVVLSDNTTLSELKSLNLKFLLGIPNVEIKFMVKINNIVESVLLNVTIYTTFDECKKMIENKLNLIIDKINTKITNEMNDNNIIINKVLTNISLTCNKKENEYIGLHLLEIINEEIMFTNE